MVTLHVGNEVRDWADVDEHWLCKQINGRRKDGERVCVRVRVQAGGMDLYLATPACGGGGGGGFRAPTPRESEVFDLWRKLHLSEPDFSCGNVHAFLVQLKRLL